MGWNVGDRVAIASTHLGESGPETFTIQAVAGNVITLNAALTKFYAGKPARKVQAEVVNLSRNVVITGDDFENFKGLQTIAAYSGSMQITHVRVEKAGR
jgi:hypothetical protein